MILYQLLRCGKVKQQPYTVHHFTIPIHPTSYPLQACSFPKTQIKKKESLARSSFCFSPVPLSCHFKQTPFQTKKETRAFSKWIAPLHTDGEVFYYFPPASEEYESLTSDDSAATAFTSGLLDDLNLDRSTPDTYRSPPAPIPFEVVLGHPQSRGSQFTDETVLQHSYEITTCKDIKLSDCKAEMESLLASLKKTGNDLVKSNPPIIKSAEEDYVCPTCLEEYDADNPRILTKCNHHFHLSCILEWMERSETCPICNQEMIYEGL
ncbi:hypothetical protein K7X08_036040 [Anisodus acutangulus]|uniref:RING-type E3 ubiquitin transferase n=1 Tax=Anisodus acutangulus TaxID=402998 RepID=A0A9Q1L6D0_9SOLA|nr:hypothetical protein K7X08_036040 [Anisodus acutangulus]